MNDEASYRCDSCGEEIIVPIDISAGSDQEYVEDCPVCCRRNVIQVAIDEDGIRLQVMTAFDARKLDVRGLFLRWRCFDAEDHLCSDEL